MTQLMNYSNEQFLNGILSFYWSTEYASSVNNAADYIQFSTSEWYKTEYRWEEKQLRELVREGYLHEHDALVPYRLHLRFNRNGEAIYQHYRVNDKVWSLNNQQLAHYVEQANDVVLAAKQESQTNMTLIQGAWNGQVFETCSGEKYELISFNNMFPEFLTELSYVVLLGQTIKNHLYINELIAFDHAENECITRPKLL